ncbi:hypothetical protein [Actinoplanes rectilineatus]|uniref:hypothetical protein n=1 Tax=Actinoplanes rectilineatus TaxID=113571 RepID=UPI0012FA9B81|nr:hypothetical protein [Actinoplanes rectilineatus]
MTVSVTDDAAETGDDQPASASGVDTATSIGIACVSMGEDDYCKLQMRDAEQRTAMPIVAEDAPIRQVERRIAEALTVATCPGETHTDRWGRVECLAPFWRAPHPEAVGRLDDALVAAHLLDRVVRIARDTDPAHPGSLVYGVRVDDVCFMGSMTTRAHQHQWEAGVLADGQCLAA